jgi:hypothetical protein
MPRLYDFSQVDIDEFVEHDRKGRVNISGTVRNLSDMLAASNIELQVSASQLAVFLTRHGVAANYYEHRRGKGNFGSTVTSALRSVAERDPGRGDFYLGYSAPIREREETITQGNAHAIMDEYGHLFTQNELEAIINYMLFGSPNGYGSGSDDYDGEELLKSAVQKVLAERGKNV